MTPPTRTASAAVGVTLAALLVPLTLAPEPGTAAAAAAPVTHVNSCWSTDNGRPVVDSVDVSPSVVDSDAGPTQVQITVQAHDTGGPGPATGVRQVSAVLLTESFEGPDEARRLSADLTPSGDGSWQGTVTVPAHTRASYAASVTAVDGADVGFDDARTSEEPPVDDALTVTRTPEPPPYPHDTERPLLEGLTLSADRVDTRKNAAVVTVEAEVTDDDSGVRWVEATFGPRGESSWPRPWSTTLSRVDGTDLFRGQVTFARWLGHRPEFLDLRAADNAGHFFRLRPPQLAERGLPSRVAVVSGPLNDSGPRIVSVQQAARSVDVRRHGTWYPVRLVLADPQGVDHARFQLSDIDARAHLHRVSGTAYRGVWTGRLQVSRCIEYGPTQTRLHVHAADRQGIVGRDSPFAVRLVTTDLTPAEAGGKWRKSPQVFTFTEPVHGISSANVVVYYSANDGYHPLTGSWSCRDPKGHRVDCLKGPVLKAAFTTDDPDASPPAYVDWSPEHHLDVLDRHGNPSDTSFSPFD